MTFKPAKRASPSSSTELMTWLWRALPKSFRASSDRTAQRGRDHLRSGEARLREDAVQVGERGQVGQEQEQAAELGAEVPRGQVELADVGDVGRDGAGPVGPLVVARVAAAWRSPRP